MLAQCWCLFIGLADIHAVFLILGYTIQGWVGFGFYFWEAGGNNTWRVPLALKCAWPYLLLLGLYWVPESPRVSSNLQILFSSKYLMIAQWVIMNGRPNEAKQSSNNSTPHQKIQITNTLFQNSTKSKNKSQSTKHMELPGSTYSRNRKRAFLTIGTTAIIQCTGVLVINSKFSCPP